MGVRLIFAAAAAVLLLPGSALAGSITYSSAGTYLFTIPTGVSQFTVDAYSSPGQNGNTSNGGGLGGLGGRLQGTYTVIGGSPMQINVGGYGTNGAGAGKSGSGGAGGGMTDVRVGSCALALSCGPQEAYFYVGGGGGGGGGSGAGLVPGNGGRGGVAPTAGTGLTGGNSGGNPATPGGPATLPGSGGAGGCACNAAGSPKALAGSGGFAFGGAGGLVDSFGVAQAAGGGGGGSGYYGGGGGGAGPASNGSGSGGGGLSFTRANTVTATFTDGVSSPIAVGSGSIVISWTDPATPTASQITLRLAGGPNGTVNNGDTIPAGYSVEGQIESVTNGGGNGFPSYYFYTQANCGGTPVVAHGSYGDFPGGIFGANGFRVAKGPLHPGSYSFRLDFSGNSSLQASTSGCKSFTVVRAQPTVGVTVNDNATSSPWAGTETTGAKAYATATIDGYVFDAPALAYNLYSGGSCGGTATPLSGTGGTSGATAALAAGTYSIKASTSTDTDNNAASDCESFSVISPNATPSCSDVGPINVTYDTEKVVPLSCTDADTGDTLTLSSVNGPAHGSLGSFSPTAVTYTPTSGYVGPDSFTYKANDATVDSAVKTVSLEVALDQSIRSGEQCSNTSGGGYNGQSFMPAVTGRLKVVQLALSKLGASGNLSIQLRTVAASGLPTSTVLASATLAASAVPDTDPAFVPVTFSAPPWVNAETRYAIVAVPASTSDFYSWCFDGADSYGRGQGLQFANGNWGANNVDYGLKTHVVPLSDSTDPEVSLTTPASGASYTVGDSVAADFACTDEGGSDLASCVGTVADGAAIDTATVGAKSFTVTGTDYAGNDTVVTHSYSVVAANTAPTCSDVGSAQSPVVVSANTTTLISLSCVDTDSGQTLTLSTVSGPSHGLLGSYVGQSVNYQPALSYSGTDSFTYLANDGVADSAAATVYLQVANIRPVCEGVGPVAVASGAATPVQLVCTDANTGQTLTLSVLTGPSHGSLDAIDSLTQTVTYTPTAGFKGTDSFTYRASDGEAYSDPQTVTLQVANALPVCQDVGPVAVSRNTAKVIDLSCVDVNTGDSLALSVVSGPSHGSTAPVDSGAQKVTYTPTTGYAGTDSFTYKANDGTGDSATKSVGIVVANTTPVCQDVGPVAVASNTPTLVQLACTDADTGETLTLSTINGPSHGSLGSIDSAAQTVTYTPNSGYVGGDSFIYKASDGTAVSSPATVSLEVANALPVCGDVGTAQVPMVVLPSTPLELQLSCTDVNTGQTLTLSKVGDPSHGTVGPFTQATQNVTYTPTTGYKGADSFTYRANDGTDNSATATVYLLVANAAPVCQDVATVSVAKNVANAIDLSCTDANSGDTLTLSVVAGPSHGALGAVDSGTQKVTYTPTAGYSGPDSFTYKASDATADSTTKTVTILVANTAPVCQDTGLVSVAKNVAKVIDLSCTDADTGETLTLSTAPGFGPSHGALGAYDSVNQKVTYTPTAGYSGPDSFKYLASDGTAESVPKTASIDVSNATPTCQDIGPVAVAANTPKTVQLTCADADTGETLGLYVVNGPAHGSLGPVDSAAQTVQYTPTAGYAGTDSFTYEATDQTADSTTKTVTLQVANILPLCQNVGTAQNPVTVAPNTAKVVQLLCTDSNTGQTLTLSSVAGPSHGSLGAVDSGAKTVTYTPTTNYTGADSFTYKANDGVDDSATKTVTLFVQNIAPVCQGLGTQQNPVVIAPATPTVLQLSCTDPNTGQTLTLSGVAGPVHGTLGPIGADQKVLYTPDPTYAGIDFFGYSAADGVTVGGAATVWLMVANAAPTCQNVSMAIAKNTVATVQLTCTDPNTVQQVAYSVLTSPTPGTLGPLNTLLKQISYTPPANFTGQVSFTYKGNDSVADSNTATVTITVGSGITCAPMGRTGTRNTDYMTGTNGPDKLFGAAGNDLLTGLGGNDCLYGEAGADTISGGTGDDLLDGGDGVDVIDGGKGKDEISGGAGDDRILAYDGEKDSIDCGTGTADQVIADRIDVLTNCERKSVF